MKKPTLDMKYVKKINESFSGQEGLKISNYMSADIHSNLKETQEVVNSFINEFENSESLNYFLTKRSSGDFIGLGGLSTLWDKNYGSLGCWIKPEYWGNNYSEERALALIELGFEHLGLNYIKVRVDKRNSKSVSSISSYMSKVNGERKYEYRETLGDKERRTVVYIVSNINYENSGGLNIIKNF